MTTKSTNQLAGTYTDRPGDVVIHEGRERQVKCAVVHARKRGRMMVFFVDEPGRRHTVPSDQQWHIVR